MKRKRSGCGCLGEIKSCYEVKMGWGHIDACWKGQSAYGTGKARFEAYGRDGYYIPGRTNEKTMSFDDFENLMHASKAKKAKWA